MKKKKIFYLILIFAFCFLSYSSVVNADKKKDKDNVSKYLKCKDLSGGNYDAGAHTIGYTSAKSLCGENKSQLTTASQMTTYGACINMFDGPGVYGDNYKIPDQNHLDCKLSSVPKDAKKDQFCKKVLDACLKNAETVKDTKNNQEHECLKEAYDVAIEDWPIYKKNSDKFKEYAGISCSGVLAGTTKKYPSRFKKYCELKRNECENPNLEKDTVETDDNTFWSKIFGSGHALDSCGNTISSELAHMIQIIYRTMILGAIVVSIILGGMDFVKATASEDDDALAKAWNKFWKRLIVVILIAITPAVLKAFLGLFSIEAFTSISQCIGDIT